MKLPIVRGYFLGRGWLRCAGFKLLGQDIDVVFSCSHELPGTDNATLT